MLTTFQTAALFNMTKVMGVMYPTYLWIHVERVQSDFLVVPGFEASHGNIYLHIKTEQTRNQTELVSGETFATFQSKYAADLLRLMSLYNIRALPTPFAS